MIFLDIDDVICTDRVIASCVAFDTTTAPPIKIPLSGDPVAIQLVNRAADVCNAKVVVSSSWLSEVGWKYTLDWLIRTGLDPAHLHPDSCIRFGPNGSKREGILDWLKQQPDVSFDRVCVIDDDPNLFTRQDPLRGRQVVVEGRDGLRLQDYRSILQKLGKSMKPK